MCWLWIERWNRGPATAKAVSQLLWGRLVNWGRMAIGLVDSAPQAKRIANPLQEAILPHRICENSLELDLTDRARDALPGGIRPRNGLDCHRRRVQRPTGKIECAVAIVLEGDLVGLGMGKSHRVLLDHYIQAGCLAAAIGALRGVFHALSFLVSRAEVRQLQPVPDFTAQSRGRRGIG